MIALDHYTVTALLYQGEARALYSGFRTADGAPVAIKVLRGEHPSPQEVARLRHEYALLRELSLAGVVRAYALEQVGRSPALVLERLAGRPLTDLLDAGPLDLGSALAIASALAGTLGAVHGHHVIHKDIKPPNIIVDRGSMRVTLIDFGVATRLSREVPRILGPAAQEGTLAYMSPEQTGRMNRAVDARTDLYALGVTLYEMLTGSLPFEETDPVELVHSHIARTPPRPSDRTPGVPAIVSDIAMKLLAKAAEDRYQSALGLKEDLDECLTQLEEMGEIEPFVLGRRDLARELRVPQRLYGREAELAALTTAFERASLGAAELVLVKGHAGVGKSALVNEIHPAIARGGGAFGAGKFVELGHGIPYAPVAQALRQILRQILAGSLDSLAGYRRRFEAALGANGRLIVDLVPELALCLDPQPEVPALGPAEAKQRFRLTFQAFLRAFTAETTLVIFLDDLHWADPASLSLLHLLLTDPDSAQILVIGAYRDNEVDAGHPLSRALVELRRAGAAVTEIAIAELPRASVEELLGDALVSPRARVAPLADVVFDKTHGNPFFLGRFLRALHREGMLHVDAAKGAWTWDAERIEEAAFTDNVVDFLVGKIKLFSPRTQRMLALAACVGDAFDQETLAVVGEVSPASAAGDLWEALEEGLVLPLDPAYRFFDTRGAVPRRSSRPPPMLAGDAAPPSLPPSLPPDALGQALNIRYRFSHDRVQQASYRLLDDDQRQEAHLRIGRLLRAHAARDPGSAALLDAVNHLNLGRAKITDPIERAELARWDLLAGRQVKASAAYEAAVGYLDAGVALLDASAWEADYPLAFALHAERAECAYLSGRFDEAEAQYEALLGRAATNVNRAAVESGRVALYVSMSRYTDAMAVGRAGLRLFEVDLPETEADLDAGVRAELAEVPQNLGGRRIEELLDAQVIVDPGQRAVLKLLTEMWTATHLVMPALRTFVVLKQVNFCLRHGSSDVAAFAYMAYGSILARVLDRYEDAEAFGRLALAIHERQRNANLTANLYFMFGVCAHVWEPLRAVVGHLEHAHAAGLATGDLPRAAYATAFIPPLLMSMDLELAQVEERIDGYLAVVRRRTWDELAIAGLTLCKQMVANLTGRTDGRGSLQGGGFDEAAFVASTAKVGFEYMACWYYAIKVELSFLYGDHAVAIAMAALAEARLGSTRGTYRVVELVVASFLSFAALRPEAGPADAARYDRELARLLAQMAVWAQHCPANYRHRHRLMRAERARLDDRHDEAMELYDQAIDEAREGCFLRDEAIAGEVTARYYLARGRVRTARAYLVDARYAYLRWGALAKVAALDEEYEGLLAESAPPSRAVISSSLSSARSSSPSTGRRTDSLDAMAVVRAAQAIASELVLEKVLERLLRITLSNAGAQRGALLLGQEGQLWVEATITLQPDEVRVGPPRSLADAGDEMCVSIVQYVERTREAVVLGDAQREARFSGDPYLTEARPRSILCLAMVHHGQLVGVLYLENNAAADAFTPARIEICRLLSSQAAIAVENALLYTRIRAVSEQLQKANAALEEEVLRRTEQLRMELAERVRTEAAREALQEEIIRAQRERLLELSTPLIPISARVVVMPLIGTIDRDRAQQVLETALHGASAHRAKVVIVDITGVKHVDADVAATLLRTAGALGMLGAEVVVTGIRPEVAQTLVGLGLDLGTMVTRGTLESGIAYALVRTDRASPTRAPAQR